jgi:lipoprotein-releasing system permease protein
MRLLSLFFSYIFRDTIRSKALLVLILTVLAAAATAILLTLGVLEGFRTMLIEGERGWLGDVVISPRSGDTSIRQSDIIESRLRSLPTVDAFAKRSHAQTVVRYEEEKSVPFRTIGITTADDNRVTWLEEQVIEGEFFTEGHNTDEAVLGKSLADDLVGIEGDGLSLHVGDTIQVLTATGDYRPMRVRGIIDGKNFSPNYALFLQKSDLEQIDSSNRNAQIVIKLRPDVNAELASRTLQNEFPSVVVRTWEEESQYVRDIMAAVKFITLSIRDLLLVTIFFVISIVIYIDVNQKRRQIGILKSMGTPQSFIMCAYATQAFVYALVGTSIGSLFFTLITLWSANHPIPLLIGDFRIIETSSIFVQTALTVFASALIGASAPVWIAARTRIIDDMRNVR